MIRKLLFLIIPLFLLVVVATVNAQTDTSTSSAVRLKQQLQEIQSQKQAVTSQIKKEVKKDARIDLRQQIKEAVSAKREEIKEIVAARKEEFRAKLQALKDEKKKVLVERIDAKLAAANAKHTDRFAQVLNNLQIILDKMSEDVNKTVAQAAIDAAKTAVEVQAAKTYTITISTEVNLKTDVGAVTSQLRLDLSATHKLVIDAKQTVQSLRKDSAIMKKESTNSDSL